jgi:hypothetical protein
LISSATSVAARRASTPPTLGPRTSRRTPSHRTSAHAAIIPASGFIAALIAVPPGCSPTRAAAGSWAMRSPPVISPTMSQVATTATPSSSSDHTRIAYQRVNRPVHAVIR